MFGFIILRKRKYISAYSIVDKLLQLHKNNEISRYRFVDEICHLIKGEPALLGDFDEEIVISRLLEYIHGDIHGDDDFKYYETPGEREEIRNILRSY